MLKLNTSYSKKVPVPDQEYSSQSYHASVELELSDSLGTGEIQNRIHETFEMVRDAVESELSGVGREVPRKSAAAESGGKHTGNDQASNKQIKYINDLATGSGISVGRFNAGLRERYGVENAYALTRKQASEVLDRLQAA